MAVVYFYYILGGDNIKLCTSFAYVFQAATLHEESMNHSYLKNIYA